MNAYEGAGMAGKEAMDTALKSLSAMTRGFQQIAAETTDFGKRSFEQSAQMFEQMTQAKSLDKAIEVQNDFAKSAYQNWVSQATKMGEILTDIAKEAYKPLESAGFAAANRGEAMQNAL